MYISRDNLLLQLKRRKYKTKNRSTRKRSTQFQVNRNGKSNPSAETTTKCNRNVAGGRRDYKSLNALYLLLLMSKYLKEKFL